MSAWDEYFTALRKLYDRAGRPSTREVEALTGKAISHTAAADCLRGARLPTKKTVLAVVKALKGDTVRFTGLWERADCEMRGIPPGIVGAPNPQSPRGVPNAQLDALQAIQGLLTEILAELRKGRS